MLTSTKEKLSEIITSFLVILYLYTSFSKLFTYYAFSLTLRTAPYIGAFSNEIGILLPLGEIAIVSVLMNKQNRVAGLKISLITLIIFTFYLMLMILSNKSLPCSCGGVISSMTWKEHLFFNLGCIAANAIALLIYRPQNSLRNMKSSELQ